MISIQQGADFTLICPVCMYVTVYENLIAITSICADICGLFAEGCVAHCGLLYSHPR